MPITSIALNANAVSPEIKVKSLISYNKISMGDVWYKSGGPSETSYLVNGTEIRCGV